MWDFKSKTLAATLSNPNNGQESGAVTAMAVSNNGYHLAVAYASSTAPQVAIWDLRKQKVIANLNQSEETRRLATVDAVAFDESGKYVVYGGTSAADGDAGGIVVSTVKEWGVTAYWSVPTKVDTLAWVGSAIAALSKSEGKITLIGKSN